jgi:hypothetical protein
MYDGGLYYIENTTTGDATVNLTYELTSASPCVPPSYVNIDTFYPTEAICYGYVTFAAKTSTSVAVDTNVNVSMYWYGDLGGYISDTVTITAGNYCASANIPASGVSCYGENYSSDSNYISPSSYGSQIYQYGATYTGLIPC